MTKKYLGTIILAFVVGAVASRAAYGQGSENAWRFFVTASKYSSSMTAAERDYYLAGVYDATAQSTLLAQFAPDYKKRMLAIVTCCSTKAKGSLGTFDDWAYAQTSSTSDQTWSAAVVLSTACLQEAGLAPAPKIARGRRWTM